MALTTMGTGLPRTIAITVLPRALKAASTQPMATLVDRGPEQAAGDFTDLVASAVLQFGCARARGCVPGPPNLRVFWFRPPWNLRDLLVFL